MTLLATARYVDRSGQSCLNTSWVVRQARPRLAKPGRSGRRPIAFLVTLGSAARVGFAASSDDAQAVQSGRAAPESSAEAAIRQVPEAYSRPFRICRGCFQPARREHLVNGDGDRPRHPHCMPADDTMAKVVTPDA